jgi:hypothetical protein
MFSLLSAYNSNLLLEAGFGNLPLSPNNALLSAVQITKAAAQNIKMFINA